MKISKKSRVKFLSISFLYLLLFAATSLAQDAEILIKRVAPDKINVEGTFKNQEKSFTDWVFAENYADASLDGERIRNFQALTKDGVPIRVKKIGAGKFQSAEKPVRWSYEVELRIPAKITDAAHISWLGENRGILMPSDFLPVQMGRAMRLELGFTDFQNLKIASSLAPCTTCRSSEKVANAVKYTTDEAEKEIFYVGANWRKADFPNGKGNADISLLIEGKWAFSDEEAYEFADSIFEEYRKLFGANPASSALIILAPFPQENVAPDRWRAETRGATVNIVSGQIPQKSIALQRLHEQLRHEIFHLWLPNGVNLSGDYAWFYEGFSIYRALRTGVELNQIRFEDYLNTVGRARQIVKSEARGKNLSLVNSSPNRWEGANNYIYAKGLLVAFLSDVALLSQSRGKWSLANIFRTVFEKHKFPAQIQDGNRAVLSILNNYSELIPITKNYVEGNSEIELIEYLEAAGLEIAPNSNQIKVREKLSGRQKDLLDDLGYNQWRKLLRQKKK